MKANPFTFLNEEGKQVTPKYPWYSLEKKDFNGEEMYRGVFWHNSDGCNTTGAFTGGSAYHDMETAKRHCQEHFERFIYSWIDPTSLKEEEKQ